MLRELFIFIGITLFVFAFQLINYFVSSHSGISSLLNVRVFNIVSFNVGYIILGIYLAVFLTKWIIIRPIKWFFSLFKSHEDIDFVNTLYAQSNAKIKSYTLVLFLVISIFFSGSLFWAYWAEVDELARGEGKVIPSAKIQTVQSLDGGIISEILVKEGSFIKSGQPLMKIDTTRFKASLDENKNALEDLLASQVRLQAELNVDLNKPMPKLVFKDKKLLNYPDIITVQKNIFKTRYQELKNSISILQMQMGQKKQELVELKSKEEQLARALVLIKEEMETIEKLVARKSLSNMDFIAIKKEYNNILGDYNSTKLSIPRMKIAIAESNKKIMEKISIFKSESAKELQKVSSEIKKYESKVISEKDKLDKTIILSPVDGIIKQINFNTIGGVVKSGVELIEIVPDSDILLVEAKIDPKDIAFINPSQKAIVKITAYDFSIYGGLDGKIVEISADSIKDEDRKDGKTYYKVVIQTDKNYLEKDNQKYSIIPGMVASVDIVTGQKTILDFILKPILKTKQSALHER